MPLTAQEITNAAIRHSEESGDLEYAIGDLEIALHIAIETLENAGLSEQFEAAIRNGNGLDVLNDHLKP